MDPRQLRAFLHIVETGSFSAAADRLHLTQPALSRQIRLLEEDLGERLLRRTGRGAEPTDAGLLLAERARGILDDMTATRQALAARRGQLSGRVCFGLPPSVGVRLTGPVVAGFHQRHPLVGLTIVEELSGVVQDGLLSGAVDLGLLYAGTVSPALTSEPLLEESLALIGAPGRMPAVADGPAWGPDALPLPVHGVTGLPLILPGRRHGLRAILEQAAFRHGVALDVSLEADSLRVLSELAVMGLGLLIHAPSAFPAQLAAGTLVARPLGTPPLVRSIVLAWSRDAPLPRAAAALADMVRTEARTFGRHIG